MTEEMQRNLDLANELASQCPKAEYLIAGGFEYKFKDGKVIEMKPQAEVKQYFYQPAARYIIGSHCLIPDPDQNNKS